MGNGSLLKKEEDDIEEEDDDIEEDENSHSISHSISLRKIRINDSILKTEERRRRFQDIHCGKFKIQNFCNQNLTKFRITQFHGISRYTI